MESPQTVIIKTCFKIQQINKAIKALDQMDRMFGRTTHTSIVRDTWEKQIEELQGVVAYQENRKDS